MKKALALLGFGAFMIFSCVVADKAKQEDEELSGVEETTSEDTCEEDLKKALDDAEFWKRLAENCVSDRVKVKR